MIIWDNEWCTVSVARVGELRQCRRLLVQNLEARVFVVYIGELVNQQVGIVLGEIEVCLLFAFCCWFVMFLVCGFCPFLVRKVEGGL